MGMGLSESEREGLGVEHVLILREQEASSSLGKHFRLNIRHNTRLPL